MTNTQHMEIEIEINEDDIILVDLDAIVYKGNDSFSHEFGTEKYPDYFYIEDFEWDKSKYSESENKAIEKYISDNFEELEKNFIYD